MDRNKASRIMFVLSCALSATTAVSTPWRSIFAPRAYCSAPGEVVCSRDCTEVQLCMGNPDGGYELQTVVKCDRANGLVCSPAAKTCVPATEIACPFPPGQLPCHAVGSYPDPFDCKVYHVCLEGQKLAIRRTCDSNNDEAYDPCTGNCTLTTSDRVCTENPVKPCSETLEVDVVPENPSIYYICMPHASGGLYPDMYRCPGDQVFDVDLIACVPTSSPTTCQAKQQQQPRRQSSRAQKTP